MIAETRSTESNQQFQGIVASSGIAIGPIHVHRPVRVNIRKQQLPSQAIESEVARFEKAINVTKSQLFKIRGIVAKNTGEQAAMVIDAQLMLLEDPNLVAEVGNSIRTKRMNAEFIFHERMDKMAKHFESMPDDYMKSRSEDFHDLANRVLYVLMGVDHKSLFELQQPVILLVSSLAPSEAGQLPKDKILGLAMEKGGVTSHAAIMARTLEIPAVIGLGDIIERVTEGQNVILDAEQGLFIVEPPSGIIHRYNTRRANIVVMVGKYNQIRDLPSVTRDDHKINLLANIELPGEIEAIERHGGEGVGLYRTELLYMEGTAPPTEEQQYAIYEQLARQLAPRPLTIRTFDLGGDKFATTLRAPMEANPFLGVRAIRIAKEWPELLRIQLRAILRASIYGNVKIMFPMVTVVEEVTWLRGMLDEILNELRATNPDLALPPVGIMIEVPSAALEAETLAKHVDFFSIGSNDLTQYMLACDRGNTRLSYLYNHFHPAVLGMINHVLHAARKEGIDVSLCGEMAGTREATILLVGMGLTNFSMSPVCLPQIKRVIRALFYPDAKVLAHKALTQRRLDRVMSILRKGNYDLLANSEAYNDFAASAEHETVSMETAFE